MKKVISSVFGLMLTAGIVFADGATSFDKPLVATVTPETGSLSATATLTPIVVTNATVAGAVLSGVGVVVTNITVATSNITYLTSLITTGSTTVVTGVTAINGTPVVSAPTISLQTATAGSVAITATVLTNVTVTVKPVDQQ